MDKTVLITGAARGIGLATSEIFSNANYNVLMLDRDIEELKKVSARISNSTTLSFDISDNRSGDEISNLISSQIGELHVLINNAGIAQFGAIESCNSQIWREVMDTNLDGMFYLSQALIPLLKKNAWQRCKYCINIRPESFNSPHSLWNVQSCCYTT